MKLKFKSILLANGEVFEDAEGEVPDDFLDYYLPFTIEGDTIYTAADAIISFQLEEERPKIIK